MDQPQERKLPVLPSTMTIPVPVCTLAYILDMAKSHIEDIETGLEDRTYEAQDNADLPEKLAAVEVIDQIIKAASAPGRDVVEELIEGEVTSISEPLPSADELVELGLNAACLAVQEVVGQTDGGLAGMMFSGPDFKTLFRPYCEMELVYAKERREAPSGLTTLQDALQHLSEAVTLEQVRMLNERIDAGFSADVPTVQFADADWALWTDAIRVKAESFEVPVQGKLCGTDVVADEPFVMSSEGGCTDVVIRIRCGEDAQWRFTVSRDHQTGEIADLEPEYSPSGAAGFDIAADKPPLDVHNAYQAMRPMAVSLATNQQGKLVHVEVGAIANKVAGRPLIYEGERIKVSNEVNLHRFAYQNAPSDFNRVHVLTDGAGGFKAILNPGSSAEIVQEGHLSDYSESRKLVDARFAAAIVAAVDEHVLNAVGTRPRAEWTDHDVLDQGSLSRALTEAGLPSSDEDVVKLEEVVSPLIFWRFDDENATGEAAMKSKLAEYREAATQERKLPVNTATKGAVAAAEAIAAHSEALGIEGNSEIQVWHLFVSLHEYCVANAVDFDAQLQEVRESLNSGDLGLPASESYVKTQAAKSLVK